MTSVTEDLCLLMKNASISSAVDDHARDGASSFVVVRPCIATIWGGGGGGGGSPPVNFNVIDSISIWYDLGNAMY